MNNYDANMDKKTKKLFQNTEFDKPSRQFTFNVMNRIEKEKTYGVKNDNLWQILIAAGLPLLYFVYIFYSKGNGTFSGLFDELAQSNYFKFIQVLSENLLQDLTVSPIVIIGIAAILLLLLFDRVIVRMLHSYK